MLAELCGPVGNGLIVGLFLAGASGSVMHCGPMCGPFVVAQVADGMARIPAGRLCELQRIRGALLLPYHIGRLTTYAALGALAGYAGSTLSQPGWLSAGAAILLAVAALLFAGHALQRLMPSRRPWLPAAPPHGWARVLTAIGSSVDRARFGGGLLLGLLLGFLPCGLLYAALAGAGASGNPLTGAAAMLAFGAGTVPALVLVGIAGHAAGRRWQRLTSRVAPAVMLVNSLLLVILAAGRLAAAA